MAAEQQMADKKGPLVEPEGLFMSFMPQGIAFPELSL
jgi:hypothetical protein